MMTYHDFRPLWWVICPVCPAQTRDITSSGWARTGRLRIWHHMSQQPLSHDHGSARRGRRSLGGEEVAGVADQHLLDLVFGYAVFAQAGQQAGVDVGELPVGQDQILF